MQSALIQATIINSKCSNQTILFFQVVHPSYNFFTYEHDLALIKLESPVILTPHINPICLPGNDDLLINENATVSGWGRLSEGGQLPHILQHVTVPILSNAKCREMFLKSGRVEHIPEIFLCAGFENGGRDSCQVRFTWVQIYICNSKVYINMHSNSDPFRSQLTVFC